jgi:hypothetical protein
VSLNSGLESSKEEEVDAVEVLEHLFRFRVSGFGFRVSGFGLQISG